MTALSPVSIHSPRDAKGGNLSCRPSRRHCPSPPGRQTSALTPRAAAGTDREDAMMLSADDHVQITQVLNRYSMAMDLRRWELMDEVFLPEGEVVMNGTVLKPSRRGVAVIREFIERCSYTHHINSTTLVEVIGGEVVVTTNVRAWHRGGATDETVLEAIGRYVDRFVRTPQGWRIARREENVPIFLGDNSLFAGAAPMMERMIAESRAEFPQA
jgi:hypothetical protein